jgi:hypothetical protein
MTAFNWVCSCVDGDIEVVRADEHDALQARLAEAERLLLVARDCLRTAHNGWAETLGREIDAFLVPDVTCATHGCTYRDGRCIRCWGRDAHSKAIDSLLDDCATVYGGPVQHDSCCLDYPRCDCNSPSEPDNEWHCSQYPGCECFAGCREKALEGQREPPYARVMCREDLPLLDEDQFNELDAMVTGQPSREIIQQAKECGCGICDACVAASRPR